jgi:FKBP-type peptidyl-prolyl cis-trans isomerase 2
VGCQVLVGRKHSAVHSSRRQEDDKDSPSPQQQHNMLSIWLAAPVMLVRLWCLKVAAAAITTLAAGGNGTHQALHAAAAVAATAVAAAPLLWPVLTYSSSSSSNSNDSSSSPLLTAAVLLAAEAACVTCTASPLPVVSAAAGCVIAASLLLLHNRLVAPRLLKFQANVGDAAKVHVALKLQGSTAVFDSTKQEEPLDLFLQPVPPELHQLWQDASSTAYWEDEGAQQQLEGTAVADNVGKQAAAAAAAAGNDGEGDTTTDSRDLYTVQQGIQGWLRDPAARWDALTPFIADAAAGMYLGQTRSVAIYNPLNVGYWNPRFTWWQPTADVMEKFKGQVPQVGEVFWYPVADGAYVPTRIQNVGEQYVELDANYGVTGTSLQLEVQLVRLYKPGDADEAGGEVVVAEAAGAADD